MSGELNELPEYSETMARLEAAKHTRSDGVEYWRASTGKRMGSNSVLGCGRYRLGIVVQGGDRRLASVGIDPSL